MTTTTTAATLQLQQHQPHYNYKYNYNYCTTPHYIQELWVRWPLQPLQPLQRAQLQPPFGPLVDSLCHPCITTTNLSYRVLILETSATALRGTTGNMATENIHHLEMQLQAVNFPCGVLCHVPFAWFPRRSDVRPKWYLLVLHWTHCIMDGFGNFSQHPPWYHMVNWTVYHCF